MLISCLTLFYAEQSLRPTPESCGGLAVTEVLAVTERSPVGSSDPKKLSVVPYKTQERQNRRNVDEKASIFLLLNIIHRRP